MTKEERIKKAEDLFMQGYNCAQSVTAAFADIYGYTEEQALKLSAGFGGGIGRMRLTCGAACGMFILAGMDCGSSDINDREGKSANYKAVQDLADAFKKEFGTLECAELLKLKKDAPLSHEASERTAEYYAKRPCVNQVVAAAKIFADYLGL
ncbi:MAG: C_GCAxxG_C_C family protein [Prevotella sp.]|nr:C_GCAxxG_C_C family protein [Prevotella sp.]